MSLPPPPEPTNQPAQPPAAQPAQPPVAQPAQPPAAQPAPSAQPPAQQPASPFAPPAQQPASPFAPPAAPAQPAPTGSIPTSAQPVQPGYGVQSASQPGATQPVVGYMSQIPGAAPGQGGVYMAVPKQNGEFAKALKAIFPTFKRMHQSQGDQAVLDNQQLKAWWWVMFLLFSLLSGLAFSVFVARSADISVGSIINSVSNSFGYGSVSPYSILSFGYWFLLFFVYALVTFIAVLLRALFVKATAATAKGSLSFTQAANVVATGLVLPAFATAAIFIIELLPIPVLTPLLVIVLLTMFCYSLFMMELLINTAMRSVAKIEKTTILSHTLFLYLWSICLGILFLILISPTTYKAITDSFSSSISDVQNGIFNNFLHNME